MKKVVNTSEVAHLWANQLQDEARDPAKRFILKIEQFTAMAGTFPLP